MPQNTIEQLSKKKILVIGSTCVDIIITLDHLPKTAEDLHPQGQTMTLGGCAYNVASMIRLLGAPVTLISPVGTGIYGEFVKQQLEQRGFPVSIRIPDQENGCCYCLVEKNGERTFLSCHGAEYTFQKSWMKSWESEEFSMVYVCGLEIEEPTGEEMIEYLELHPERQLFYAPGPRGIRIAKEKTERLFRLRPILHINEQESYELSGLSPVRKEDSIRKAAGRLLQKTGNTVIITLGARGTYCVEKDGSEYMIPAVPAKVVNTIGAGDSHIGAVMASLSLGLPMREAIFQANRAAAAVVSVKGSTLSPEQFHGIF
ncbi:MAG: carbohydrate kinase family protein [Otoolea sp.]